MVARIKPDEPGESVCLVREMTDAKLAKRYDVTGDYTYVQDFAHELPKTHLRLTRGDPAATIYWPQNEYGLTNLLTHFRASGDDCPEEILFKLLNDELTMMGREPWTPRDFAMVLAQVDDENEARDLAEQDRLVVHSGGRRKSQNTYIVEKICNTIHCGRSRGYTILRFGTGVADQRDALAKAFSNDPDRRLPRNWEPPFAGRSWGRESAYSFERYVLDRVDAFEGGNIGATLAILLPRFEEGWTLPADDLETLLRSIRDQALPITADAAFELWTRFVAWKRRHRD
jgi:hypothetical protein